MSGLNTALEITISHYDLDNLRDNLYKQRDELQTILNDIKSADEKLCENLVGKSKDAFEEKVKIIEDELKNRLEALTEIIDNVNITNVSSLETDMNIASHIGVE